MLEYIILIAAVLILSLVCFNKFAKGRNQKIIKAVYLCACFALMLMYSVLRVNIGWDYSMYAMGFFQMARSGFDTLEYSGWEYGFTILTKFIAYFTKEPRIYLAIIALICLSGPFYAILRYSKKAWISVLLYINLYFFYCSMNFLRQSIAISIIMFAYTFLIERKFLRYALLIAAASCFHVTALVMIPVYFLSGMKLTLKAPLLYCFLILWFYISSNSALDILGEYFRTDYRQSVFLTQGLGFIHIVIPGLILFSGMRLLLKPDKFNLKSDLKTLTLQTNLMYFSCMWIAVMLRHSILERFSYYTYIFVILYIPELLKRADEKYKNHLNRRFFALSGYGGFSDDFEKEDTMDDFRKRPKKLQYFLIFIILTVSILYNLHGLTAYDRGVHGIYPYQSWWSG